MALIIAGDRSGVGKTTITLAILAYLAQQGNKVQSFKVGPDYIDPMFHQAATGLPCRNLDPVLTSPSYVQACFSRHAQNANWAVIEGVMGLFDGIRNLDGTESLNDYGSTAHIARLLNLPVLLVLDCSRLSSSIAAIAFGYANLDPRVKIAGIILNKVASDRHLELLETALKTINIPILGVLRRNATVAIGDRHLGLIPSAEIPHLNSIFAKLAHLAKTSFNWEKLFPLLNTQQRKIQVLKETSTPNTQHSIIRIAVAKDRAFNFYYQDNLDILTELGAELIFWSPIKDRSIPDDIQGLYFGGGFPEIFAQQLAANKIVLQQLKQIIQSGIPTYAECGGLMYLCQQLIDLQKQTWSMVRVIPSTVTMQAKLTLGYRQAKALQNSPLVPAQKTVTGHEFHRSQLTELSPTPQWQLQGFHHSSPQLSEGWRINQLHASYLHLHWGESKFLAQRFIRHCRNY
ncbi:MAG: cobyrinate a,c-diamide synthase [Pleurocapsa sp. MO_192.B19]|nr:cobyrinate a,c-diamide synthase [Pleurocapsa sp. MO_192.B19]